MKLKGSLLERVHELEKTIKEKDERINTLNEGEKRLLMALQNSAQYNDRGGRMAKSYLNEYLNSWGIDE